MQIKTFSSLVVVLVLVLSACSGVPTNLKVTPEVALYTRSLGRAHAHNDYEHARPLFDALGHGFNSVEADVYELSGELYVAHYPTDIRPERTLRSLYLDPLRKHIRANGGKVYRDGTQLILLIDAKTLAEPTYEALRATLADYQDILTVFGPGTRVKRGPVLAVISGNRARETMARARVRYAALDGRLSDLGSTIPALLMPLISDNWDNTFSWQGDGDMPSAERQKLHDIVEQAHARGQKVRFWETPDEPGAAREAVWRELVTADVDLISTDDLTGLEAFLLENDR